MLAATSGVAEAAWQSPPPSVAIATEAILKGGRRPLGPSKDVGVRDYICHGRDLLRWRASS